MIVVHKRVASLHYVLRNEFINEWILILEQQYPLEVCLVFYFIVKRAKTYPMKGKKVST